MALVIPDDHYQCFLPMRHSGLQRAAAITFGVRVPPGVENPVEVADDVLVAFSAAFADTIDSSVTYGPVSVYFDQAGQRGSVEGQVSSNGTAAGRDSIPPAVAILIRKQTARVGRPGRGRFFLPWCVAQTDLDETGNVDGPARVALQADADSFLVALDNQRPGMEMVILHDEAVPGGTTPSLVTALLVDPRVGTQRRRNRG